MESLWVNWNIPAGTTQLPQGVKLGPELPDGSRQATGQRGIVGYRGPCAPTGADGCTTFLLFMRSISP